MFRKLYTCVFEPSLHILLASFINYYLSFLLFDQSMIKYLDKVYEASYLKQIPLFRNDQKHLAKMVKLWPPYDVFYFSILTTTAVYLFVRKILKPLDLWKLFSSERPSSKATECCLRMLTSSFAATATFLLLLQMERLAELSLLVLTLNFLHTQLIFMITTLTLSLSFVPCEKTKTE